MTPSSLAGHKISLRRFKVRIPRYNFTKAAGRAVEVVVAVFEGDGDADDAEDAVGDALGREETKTMSTT